jgi:putative ABC transport system permease protein
VVKDFHFQSFHNIIEPLIIKIPEPDHRDIELRMLTIRFKSGTLPGGLSRIEDTWRSLFPNIPFNFHFVDDMLESQYYAENRMAKIFNYFSIFAIFIACLGLYGLTLFSIEQKTKEIGIRKVLGATIPGVANLFTKDVFILVVIANLISWPVAYYAMNKWLQNFAYRIEMHWWMFLFAGTITLMIALLTISWQAIRAATANPVEALRYE